LAVLEQNVVDLKGPEKLSEALQKASEALASTSEALASTSAAGPNARVLPENKSIIIFVFF